MRHARKRDTGGFVLEALDSHYRVVWYGGASHGFHLEARGFNEAWGDEGRTTWTECGYRTMGDQSRNLTEREAKREIEKWVDWIDSGDEEALEFC